MAATAPNPKPPNQAAAWTRNAVVLVAMTLLIVCGYRACVPDDPATTVKIAEETPAPLPPVAEAPPVVEPPPFVEPELWVEPEPIVEPEPVVAAPAPKAVAPAPVVAAKKPIAAPKRSLETGPVVAGVAAATAAGAAGAAVGGGSGGGVPPVDAAGPEVFAAAPTPPPGFLPIGPPTEQFTDPLADVGADAASAFGVRPGLPLRDTSLAILQPCQASSCGTSFGVPVGRAGLVIVGGGLPRGAP